MKILKLGIAAIALLTTMTLGTALRAPIKPQPINKADLDCLARNIYHEARGEPLEGQFAVAQVTLNRVHSPQFHNTVCGVVYAYRQFSWTLDKSKRVRDMQAWQTSLKIARIVLTQNASLPDFPALYFHTSQVNPRWNRGKKVVSRIGNHIFYS